jgi:shikimate dehydrogenase
VTEKFSLNPAVDNYCVIGNPIAHSLSPRIHQAFALQTGQKIQYQAVQVDSDGFQAFLHDFQARGGKGLNVTLPFKGEARRAMDVVTARAGKAESVNTIWFTVDGARHGDTTDGRGLVRDLRNCGIQPADKRILLLGAGGAVRAVIADLFDARPAAITLANRTHARAEQLARQFSEYPDLTTRHMGDLRGQHYDLVINGTSASLKGEMPALPDDILAPAACCYDMAYGKTETVFVQWAKRHGAALAVDGLGMLVEQAAEAFFIWRGIRPDTQPVIESLRREAAAVP